MINALILHFTNYAPLWSIPGKTAYLFYIGYNIEIATFFIVSGILFLKTLSIDKNKKISGIPNRFFLSIAWGIMALIVEYLLYKGGILGWDYSWWVWCVAPSYAVTRLWIAYMYDNFSFKKKIIATIMIASCAIIMNFIFVIVLKWI